MDQRQQQQQQQNSPNGPPEHQQQHHPQLQAFHHHHHDLHADAGNSTTPLSHHHQQQQQTVNAGALSGINPQIMGQLMTNPALAAAAAASPLFPPSAFQTNPGAFLTLPEYYTSPAAIQNDQNAKGSTAVIASTVGINNTTQQVTAGNVSNRGGLAEPTPPPTSVSSSSQSRQPQEQRQQQQQNVFAFPAGLQQALLPYGTGIGPNGAIQMVPGTSNSAQAVHQLAANAANAQSMISSSNAMVPHPSVSASASGTDIAEPSSTTSGKISGKRKKDMTAEERAQQNRDRNREHARSTRLRKKAYIQKLKELVEGLHAERTEEVRQRRVAIQHLAEMQNVRRAVIHSFLRFHAGYEKDERKWSTILEDGFWLKQPVTPYRCFRRSEIEHDCRICRDVQGVIADAASVAAMIESVGSRSARWIQIKREDFLLREEERTGCKRMPRDIMQQSNRFQHAISSLSSSSNSSGSNNGSSGEEGSNMHSRKVKQHSDGQGKAAANKVSNSSNEGKVVGSRPRNSSGDFHDYHAKPLPDPKILDTERNSEGDEDSGDDSKRASESSSGEDSAAAIKEGRPPKRQKTGAGAAAAAAISVVPGPVPTPVFKDIESAGVVAAKASTGSSLPQNIAKRGGIAHNVRSVVAAATTASQNGNARLARAPAVALPPFAGIGRHSIVPTSSLTAPAIATAQPGSNARLASGSVAAAVANPAIPDIANAGVDRQEVARTGPAVISGDVETSSSNSSRNKPQTRAYYHVNEDDMILMDNIIMCPFIFRTQDAVLCGSLAECVMPGMLRGHFSSRNKLLSVEMIYDAMGFMQQLERASGSEMIAQIIPGSLEMALSPGSEECRVITLAESPYRIVNVNEAWTKLTRYSQMEAEGMELFTLLESPGPEDQAANAPYDLGEVVEGRCKCTTRFHCDKDGREYVDFISSYPLTNASDEVTHLLHVCKELAPPGEVSAESSEPSSSSSAVEGTAGDGNDNDNEKDTDATS